MHRSDQLCSWGHKKMRASTWPGLDAESDLCGVARLWCRTWLQRFDCLYHACGPREAPALTAGQGGWSKVVTHSSVGVQAPDAVMASWPATFLQGPAAATGVALINSVGSIGGMIGPALIGVHSLQHPL